MNVSIIIPNYNGEELLKKNLAKVVSSLNKCEKDNTELIIIDDCSSDNSLQVIENERSRIKNKDIEIKVLKNDKNLGFSSTVNRGVENAKGEIVILLNTDILPEEDFIMPLLRHFEDKKMFAVGCMDKSLEDGKIILRGRGVGTWSRGFVVHSRGEVDKTDTFWVSGGSGAFRREIWNELNGFRSLYNPFYWEDIDLSYRAVKSGYKIVFEPKSIVLHEHQKGIIKNIFSSNDVKRIAYRNQFIFIWTNITDLNFVLSHLAYLPYHFMKALINFDFAFFLGFFSAFIKIPKIVKLNIVTGKSFVLGDKEVLNQKI